MGTAESRTMTVMGYRDDHGRPTCCAMIDGEVLRCVLLDDSAQSWPYCRYLSSWPACRDEETGLIPDHGCPIWKGEQL